MEKASSDDLQDSQLPEDVGVDYSAADQDELLVRRQPFWKKIGGDGLVVSIVIHVVLLILFGAWVVSSWTDAAKTDPDTFATGAGGGAAGERAKIFEHKLQPKNAKNLAKTSARITSKSSSATLALPDIPTTSSPSLISGMTGGGSSKGFGGGSGGGIGSGKGAGVGNGKNFVGLFGAKFGISGLTGTFYDLKQDKDKVPTKCASRETGIGPYREAVHEFLNANWNPIKLRRYYVAPENLILSQLFIPSRGAGEAPKAFNVEKDCQPSRWVVHYKGNVKVPQDVPFRFVGSGDDWLIVRWDGKIALDAGYEFFEAGAGGDYKDFKKTVDDKFPINRAPGGLAHLCAGPWITETRGKVVPIEILFGETPGGVFDVYLTIEVAKSKQKVKGEYEGEGKLKLLRFNSEPVPEELTKGTQRLPNFDWEAEGWIFEAAKATGSR